MPKIYLLASLLLGLFLTACGTTASSSGLQTQHADSSTQIAVIRSTATSISARSEATIQYAGTRTKYLEEKGRFQEATLVAQGTDIGFIEDNLGNLQSFSLATATRNPDTDTEATESVDNPPNATKELVASLSNIVTASSVGKDDCALGQTTRFSIKSNQIYVVATANGILPGTKITSRWLIEDKERVSFDFRPNFQINGQCIWFFLEPSDTEFTPGSWQVKLEINGREAGEARFTISDS